MGPLGFLIWLFFLAVSAFLEPTGQKIPLTKESAENMVYISLNIMIYREKIMFIKRYLYPSDVYYTV
ncbi:hypothetical protein GCM10027592_07260 [Spirosoma flavus]